MQKDEGKTKEQLLNELEEMRQRIKELETSETERKRAQETLKESEEKYRIILENTRDVIFQLSPLGIIQYVSPKVEHIYGYKPEDLIGKHLNKTTPVSELPKALKTLRSVLSGKVISNLEINQVSAKGEIIPMEITASPVRRDGKIIAVQGVMRDITERKQAEEEIKRTRDDYFTITNLTGDIIVKIDREGKWTFVNDGGCKFWGKPRKKLLGIEFADYLHPDDTEKTTAAIQEMIKTQQLVRGVINRQKTPEGWRMVEWNGSPIFDETGNYVGMQVTGRDITERKQLEEAQREHATAQARAEEVQQSRQRIIAMQESLRRDIAQQIHGTVQNKLIILMHRLADLERSSLSEQMAAEVADLRQKLEEVVEDHIRPISHRLFPSILRRGLVPALQSLVDQFETVQPIDMELSEELKRQERINPRFITEGVRLAAYRIAEEALVNATKHAKAKRVTVKLGPSSEGWLGLTVRDEGRGFDMESASAGLGILMMQDYAQVVGGSCVIKSTPGKGTEVTAIVPLAKPGIKYPETAEILE